MVDLNVPNAAELSNIDEIGANLKYVDNGDGRVLSQTDRRRNSQEQLLLDEQQRVVAKRNSQLIPEPLSKVLVSVVRKEKEEPSSIMMEKSIITNQSLHN